MKLILAFLFVISVSQAGAQAVAYDSVLAHKLNADEYGMRKYVLVILKKVATKKYMKQAVRDSLFRGHMNNINRLADAGLLAVAGPFGNNNKGYSGVFIFNVNTIEEAKALVDTDPAVKGRIFSYEAVEWYCSAALQQIPLLHKSIEKKQH